jgi:zinc transport system substrate-binding protein
MLKYLVNTLYLSALILTIVPGFGWSAGAAPKVVASILPIHSLVAGVMAGVGEPRLLLPGAASPHSYALRPSNARALQNAALVFWVGPGLENFLAKPLAALSGRARIVALSELADLRHRQIPATSGAGHQRRDLHIWLDPANGMAIVTQVIKSLARLDPDNGDTYQRNGNALRRRIEAASRRIEAQVSPVKRRPFVVIHDGYRHFAGRFGLTQLGALIQNTDIPPGAKRLRALKRQVREYHVVCVFGERRAGSRLLVLVAEGTGARTARLDALGLDIAPGPDAYFTLMARLADAFTGCLSGRE